MLPGWTLSSPGGDASRWRPASVAGRYRLTCFRVKCLRYDLPSVRQFHECQIIGEVPGRDLAFDLRIGRGRARPVDVDDEVAARQALTFGRTAAADQVEPLLSWQVVQFAIRYAEQMRYLVEQGTEF